MKGKRPVTIRGVQYESQAAAGRAFGVSSGAIYKRIKRGTLDDCGINDRGGKEKCPVLIRGVLYESQSEAARVLGSTQSNISRALDEGRVDSVGLGRNATTKRKVIIDGVQYDSQYGAARALNLELDSLSGAICRRRNRGIKEFDYKGHHVVIDMERRHGC